LFSKKSKIEQGFSLIYLAILSGIILVILIMNGFLEVNRTKKGFYLLLEREATVLLQHFEKNVQETVLSLQVMESTPRSHPNPSLSSLLFGLEESVAEYLLEAANRVDQLDEEEPLTPPDLQSITDRYSFASIEIYDPNGHLVKGWPPTTPSKEKRSFLRELIEKKRSVVIHLFGKFNPGKSEEQTFSIAIWRKITPGMIGIYVNGEQMKRLLQLFAMQRAISDINLREGILFISVQDSSFNVLAHTDPAFIGKKEEDPFLKEAFQYNHPLHRLYPSKNGEEVFEVAKSLSLGNQPIGLVRIGFSSKEIHPILDQIKKNVALSILFFLILGISAIALIWENQNRHLRKMREMEDRIQLAGRLSSLGQLAAGVAHEIRNPLNAIGMGLQRLKREFLPQDESKKEEYLSFTEVISKEIRRVNEIIEQFLALSRPFQLNLRISSLQDLLKNLITLFQEEASSQGITLQAEIDSNLPPVKMDPERLTQAFINIMKNGMQAMDRRGTLRVEATCLKDRVEVTFSDSGSGISPDQMEKIFNYYYTTKEEGVGLGLPIAHRIIEAHGGQLKVDSQVGVGTKVTVLLPLTCDQ
jgi:two-component system sensor histidine kinase HydH